MRSLALSNTHVHAIVSNEDYAHVSEFRWRLMNHGYVATGSVENRPNKTPRDDFSLLHRIVVGLPKGRVPEVDHINGDKLDCRRENLRIVTRGQNIQNNNDPMRGVYLLPSGNWRAMIRHEGELMHLGVFAFPEYAQEARLKKEVELGWINTLPDV